MAIVIAVENATDPEVRGLAEHHLDFSRSVTPVEGVSAFDPDGLDQPGLTVFGARKDGQLVGIVVLARLTRDEAELKTLHTIAGSRRRGIGRALVGHVLEAARECGYRRVRLETGNFEAFAPARALYRSCGFSPCDRFGPYVTSSTSACMAIVVA